MNRLWILGFLIFPAALPAQTTIPPGTILPVRLESSLSSGRSKQGDAIRGRIMQDVPLPGGAKIRAGARVLGHVRDSAPASKAQSGRITLVLDKISASGQQIPVVTNLRAIASLLEVDEAQIPEYGGDRGTPSSAFTTTQIGGEMVYRGGGHVMDGTTIVGEPAPNGVLARVRAVKDQNCRGAVAGNGRPQALWIFSSDACGAYGLPDLHIVHAGRTEPIGEIVLEGRNGDVHLRGGSGMLLRINSDSR